MYLTYPSFISGVSEKDYENQFGPNVTWTSTTSSERAIPYHPPHGTSVALCAPPAAPPAGSVRCV